MSEYGSPEITPELLLSYLRRRAKDVAACRTAHAAKDWETIARVGHKMKGNAVTFGIEPLERIGTGLEDFANRGDSERLAGLIAEFDNIVATELKRIES